MPFGGLLTHAHRVHLDFSLNPEGRRALQVAVLEFSRDRKMMSVLAQRTASRPILFCKGAPEAVLGRCTQVVRCPEP